MYSSEYLRRLHQQVHASRLLLSEVNQQCVDESELSFCFLSSISVEFVEQKCHLLGESVRDSLWYFFRRR